MNCPKCNLETESMLEIIAISFQGYCFTCEKTAYQNNDKVKME